MKFNFKGRFIQFLALPIVLFLSLFLLATDGAQESQMDVRYHTYSDFTRALKNLASVNPKIVKLQSLGKTLQGRDLWMIQLSGAGVPEEKQALLIVANLEGDHVIGSEVALGIAGQLVRNYGKDEKTTAILDKRTFYIVPRLNPDGAEVFFDDLRHEHTGNLTPRDEDYDWQVDEDGLEDLNGDGYITLMRVKDKEGEWIVDEEDSRLMKKKEDGTPLDKLYKLYPEGIDNDRDELYNEDGPGGFNINRNFPHNFGYKPKGMKVYPASEKETQALIDFMTRFDPDKKTQPHKNICGVLIFSKYDNLAAGTGIECGTPTFPEPKAEVEAPSRMARFMSFRMGRRRGADAAVQPRPTDPQPKKTEKRDEYMYKAISEKYKEMTNIKSAKSDKPCGSFLEYAYFQYGVPAFSANLWSLREGAVPQRSMPQRGDRPGEAQERQQQDRQTPQVRQMSTTNRAAMMQRFMNRSVGSAESTADATENDKKWLKWIDEENNGKGFVDWTNFHHTQLGEVEIGGFEPYLKINPPIDQIPTLIKGHADFALYLAEQFAQIALDEPRVEKLSTNLYRITLTVHNTGKFPYATAMGVRTQNINPIVLKLEFEDNTKMELFAGSKRIDITTLDAGGEKEYTWTVLSPSGKKIDLHLWARHGGGRIVKTLDLE